MRPDLMPAALAITVALGSATIASAFKRIGRSSRFGPAVVVERRGRVGWP